MTWPAVEPSRVPQARLQVVPRAVMRDGAGALQRGDPGGAACTRQLAGNPGALRPPSSSVRRARAGARGKESPAEESPSGHLACDPSQTAVSCAVGTGRAACQFPGL